LNEELTNLMKRDWKVSEKDIKRAHARNANFFKVMNSSEAKELRVEPFTSKKEKMWDIKEATNRKIYLTVMWFQGREIIAVIVSAVVTYFWLFPKIAFAAIYFAVLIAVTVYIMFHLMRPNWHHRLYHDRGMYHQSSFADAFYGEIDPLSIEERGIRPKPAWITHFINLILSLFLFG